MESASYKEIVRLMNIIAHKREAYDSHGPQVAMMATRMAIAVGMNDADVELVGIAAQLHDIGKLFVRDELINANRKLSPKEFAEVQTHSVMGWHVVRDAGYHPIICDVVKHHHERQSGAGYPLGLKGEEISLPARIVGICDVYEAMTNDRSYRIAESHEGVKRYMLSRRGKDFDANLVDIFFRIIEPGELER